MLAWMFCCIVNLSVTVKQIGPSLLTDSCLTLGEHVFASSQHCPVLAMIITTHVFSPTADFGFARYLQSNMMAATLCGSPMYMVSVFNNMFLKCC